MNVRAQIRRTLLQLRLAPVVLCLLTLSAACLQGARAPSVTPRGTLSLSEEGALQGRLDEFAVVFATPKGQGVDPREVSIVFNRPMRPLDLAGGEAPFPAVLKPSVPGRWQWVGTSAGIFMPNRPDQAGVRKHRLPRATEYRVEVPAGTQALDGTALAKGFDLSFSTARPRIVGSTPHDTAEGLVPNTTFELLFNQPVDEAALRKATTMKVAGKPALFDLTQPDPQNPQKARIRPRSPLRLDSKIEIEIGPELRSLEGPLTAGQTEVLSYRTYGPLDVAEFSCDTDTPHRRCAAGSGLSFDLTNPVKLADLKRHLTITPAVKIRWPTWLEDDGMVEYASIDASFLPGRSYRLKIRGGSVGLRDKYGQALARDFSKTLDFDDRWPVARLGLYGRIFEPTARPAIPVASINTTDLELAVAPLTEAQLQNLDVNEYEEGRPPKFEQIARMPGAKVRRLATSPTKNAVATHYVRPEDVLGGAKRGPIAIGIRYTPGRRDPTTNTAVVQVTDLGISAKWSPFGSMVWVTRLSTAAPVSGASVTIRRAGKAVMTATTDAEGFAEIPKESFRPDADRDDDAVLIARSGDDWTYRHVDRSLSGWRFGIPYSGIGAERPFGMVFSDRGIYRPGDRVRIKGIVRKDAEDGTATPAGQPAVVTVSSPDGNEIFKANKVLSAFGTFDAEVPLAKTASIGTHFVAVTVGGSKYDFHDISGDFEVAEYRRAEFAVAVESDRPSYTRGDSAKWITRGDFLFGAPMGGADTRAYVTRDTSGFRPPGMEGYVVDDSIYQYDLPETSNRQYVITQADGQLDKRGLLEVAAKLDMPGQSGPELVTVESEVTDISRQTIAASTSAIVHPGEYYVALDAGDLFVAAGSTVRPEVLAVGPKGKRLVGANVKIDLIRRRWSVANQGTAGSGMHRVSTPVDDVLTSCAVVTQKGPTSCALAPPAAGYYLVRATSTDRRNNPIAASESLYVTGAGNPSWRDSDSLELELVTDKDSYEIGQTARILVKSPFAKAQALVTVERGGIRSRRRIAVSGPMSTINVPITDDMHPNAYVSVLLLRGRSRAAPKTPGTPDVGAPGFRLGYAELPINPESRRLSVNIAPSSHELTPGANLSVDLTVRDRHGKPVRSEVTLYAVDEGVLSLIGYKTPDPIPTFAAPRDLQVKTLESRMALAKTFNPFGDVGIDKGLDGGGGGEGGPGSVRRDFRAAAYFNPSVMTGADGTAKVSFKLPDSLTTYRLMAVAVAQDDRFGYGDDRVVTSRKLMARPALPRFLRAGDRLEGGVIVTSKGLDKAEVEVTASVDGLVLSGDAIKRVSLERDASTEVRFALDAPRAGKAKLRFVVKAGKEKDAVEVVRDVETPMSLETVALYGDTTGQSAEQLGDLSAIRSDVGALEVRMSSTALVGLDAGADQLLDYPYGCTEQLVSRLVPMVPLRGLAKDFGFALPKNTDDVIETTVAKILSHQRGDGGFGLWADSPSASGWVTAYALWGLHHAEKGGAPVPAASIEQATRYLKGALEREEMSLTHRATSPFMLYVLAEVGQPDPGRVSRLYDDREKLPLFSKALLLQAMVLSKSDREAIGTFADELSGSLTLSGPIARASENTGDEYAVLMDSSARTSAMVLRALIAARPSHPMAARLAKGLLADRKGGAWRSTQETSWALLALDEYRKAQEKVAPDFDATLFLGQSVLAQASFHGRSLDAHDTSIPAMKLTAASGSPLAFDVDGSGRLFYEARLRYARKQLPKNPLDRGFFVQKRMRAVTADGLSQALQTTPEKTKRLFEGGALVLADIVVVTPRARNFVVIDSALPAGFEAVDSRLATTSSRLDLDGHHEPDDSDARATGESFENSWYLREVRDDRVLFFVDHMPAGMFRYRYLARATSLGSFVTPPTRAEEMYSPEVFGRTGASMVKIQGAP